MPKERSFTAAGEQRSSALHTIRIIAKRDRVEVDAISQRSGEDGRGGWLAFRRKVGVGLRRCENEGRDRARTASTDRRLQRGQSFAQGSGNPCLVHNT